MSRIKSSQIKFSRKTNEVKVKVQKRDGIKLR